MFSIDNLPYGVFSTTADPTPRIGVAIDDQILDLRAASVSTELRHACAQPSLNVLMSLGKPAWSALRRQITVLLEERKPETRGKLVPQSAATMHLPAAIGDYSDFYASLYHATNVGRMLRPDNPLMPNFKYVPVGYHGRSSTITVSGTPVRRPSGQTLDAATGKPSFGPTRALDYELEVGLFIGPGNPAGQPIPIDAAGDHIFGLCLVNDWSARDIQAWEYQPLGPFLAKSFATTVSPWVVTMEALAPFRVPAFRRDAGDPEPLPYLCSAVDAICGGLDLTLELSLSSLKMREAGMAPFRLSRGNFRDLYWTMAQLVAHHASNGCVLRPGDLIASGTVSGATREALGSLMEITRRGSEPLRLPSGEERTFLEDGDEIVIRGWCERQGYASVDFGECRGRVISSSSGYEKGPQIEL
jgi:fumarylacetoacetase